MTTRNPGILGGLLVACVVCTSMLIACAVYVIETAHARTSVLFTAIALVALALAASRWARPGVSSAGDARR